jgi:hypothetical protein
MSGSIMRLFATRSRRLLFAAALVVAVFFGVGLVVVYRPSPPAVVLIPLGDAWTKRKPTFLDRCKARLPMSVWKLKYSLFGPVDRLDLDNAVLSFRNWSETSVSDLSLGNPTFTDTNGLRVWLVDQSELKALRRRVEQTAGSEIVSSPGISTGIGMESQLHVTQKLFIDGTSVDAGVMVDFVPRVRKGRIDLDTIMMASEPLTNALGIRSIRTNLALAARFQIPHGSGIFLLDAAHDATNRNRFGVMISPTLQKSRR